MPRNEGFLPRNNGNCSESIPRNFFGTKYRSQPYAHSTPPVSKLHQRHKKTENERQLGCLRNFVSSKFRIFRMFFFISYTIRKWQQFRENNRNWKLILGPCRLILGPCRLTLEPCMLTLKSPHAQPGFMEAHPRPVEVYLGVVEPHSGALVA
jgi:hypothetical protein